MHASVRTWVRMTVEAYGLAELPTVEVGSYNVNGGVRDLFTGRYWGLDIRPGPGVDVVWDIEVGPHTLIPAVDVVVCLEMLEHTPHPWRAVEAMADSLVVGGHLLLTTRGPGFPRHDHPSDFYRFTEAAIEVLMFDAGLGIIEIKADPQPGLDGVFVHATR